MSSEPSPFIPAALDDANLTPHEFRVFCRVARRGQCTESVARIADATRMNEKTVRRALKALRDRSMVERTKRPGTTSIHEVKPPSEWTEPLPDQGDPQNRDFQKKGDHPSQKKGGPSKGYPLEGNPLEGSYSAPEIEISGTPPWSRTAVERLFLGPTNPRRKTSLPDDHPAVSERHLRYRRAADWSLRHLRQAEDAIESFRIPSTLRRKINDDENAVIEGWSDTFRLLQEQDDYEWSEVRYAIHWLFTQSDWLREGYIASISSLRKKTRGGERTKFDVILMQSEADSSYDGPSAGGTIGDESAKHEESRREEFERKRAVARRAVGAEP